MSLRDAIAKWLCDWEDQFDWETCSDRGPYYQGADQLLKQIRSYYSGHPERVSKEMIANAKTEQPDYEVEYLLNDSDWRSIIAAALSKVE